MQPASQPQPASEPQIAPTGTLQAPGGTTRLGWLDALRGIAALCVVFDHLTYSVLQPVRDSVYHWFDPGQYGVFVFFLVSGYIVPASLERKGSVRGFWVSRVFRLYPLYLFALSAMIVLWASGIGSLSGMDSDAVTASFADVFMLQSVLSTAGSARMRSGHDGRTPTPLRAWQSSANTAPTIGMCHISWR